ncbi:MAG: clostripain-related cysteine peptidase, partial [Caldilinea sp.]
LYFAAGDDEPRTVTTQRRRRSEPPAGGRERAEAPTRDRAAPSTGGGARPPSGGGVSSGGGGMGAPRPPGFGGGGGARPGNPMLMIGLVIVLLLCIGPFLLFNGFGGDDGGSQSQSAETLVESAAQSIATARPAQQSQPAPSVNLTTTGDPSQKWLIMLYQDADDKILEKDIFIDLNEAERVGSNDQVQIVSQIDRYRGGFDGDGDWHGARRYYVTQDDDLMRLGSELVEDLGEVNMANGDTLVDFVKWAVARYPADKYVLILSDHGMDWPGGWSDPDPGRDRSSASVRAPIVDALGNQMYLAEIDEALARARAETGIDKFELVGMDACLMGHIEVLSALSEHARYAVLSQETEPALGWAYASFLHTLQQNPGIDGGQLGQLIVDSYIDEDARITDEQQRLDLYGRAGGFFGMSSVPSASDTAAQMGRNVTLAAIDLGQTPALLDAVNEFAHALQDAQQKNVAKARSYAQSFTSIFGKEVPASYIDLGHFIQLVQQVHGGGEIGATGDRVLATIQESVLADKNGEDKPGATGVSIYFPNSQLYGSPVAGPPSYTAVAQRFAQDSLWDDFLAFHYTGRTFESSSTQLAVPEAAAVRSPAAGEITVGPIEKSGDVAAPGRPITLRAVVDGPNVGYIYFFTGFFDRAANSIFVADQDYLESSDTREVNGVYYPEWGEGAFTVEFEWEPLMFAIEDGVNRVTVALRPESYGATYEDAVYSVDGLYTYAADGEQRRARLYFRDGVFQQVFGFTGDGSTGAPREILPEIGDTFIVDEQWLDLDSSGQVAGRVIEQGGVLTFGSEAMRWVELDAAVGDYMVGFIVEDLDGNKQEVYTQVRVE